jgi:hypothetical protein
MIVEFLFLFLSIILIAQAGITIYTYHSEKKATDLNYWWSVTVLVSSIMGLLASAYMLYRSQSGAGAVSGGDAASTLKSAEAQAQNLANAATARATAASNASKAVELAKAAGIKV